jgi:hypothetical protein
MSKIELITSALVVTALFLPACGGDSPSPKSGNQLPDCPSGNCGKETFRRAVPTRSEVKVDRPTGRAAQKIARKKGANQAPPAGHTRTAALEPVSPALISVDEQVGEIDAVVEEIFAELESVAGTTPEVETDTEHRWRTANPDLAGFDDVLEIKTADGATFDVAYYIVPEGEDVTGVAPVIHGDVRLSDDDDLDFELDIELDAYADLDPSFGGQGLIVVAAMPLEGGLSEHWFDYHDVSFGDGSVETSRTTAWAFGEDSGALEYVAEYDGHPVTIYARWDETGGRYDHHAQFTDAEAGVVDEVATNCWDASGAEEFDAWAIIDKSDAFYGELDGEEGSCSFGPVQDHPNPGADFDELPESGAWEALELLDWCDVSASC